MGTKEEISTTKYLIHAQINDNFFSFMLKLMLTELWKNRMWWEPYSDKQKDF